MTIHLDHFIVSAHDPVASAQILGELLDVPWSVTGLGSFSPVYINEGLTLDFIQTEAPFPVEHFCFRVSPTEFDAILTRIQAAEIPYRSSVRGSTDFKISTQFGGKGIYWNEPDGHQWELLTVSYARAPHTSPIT